MKTTGQTMDCPECGKPMIRRKSKFGDNYWWGCSGWPKCQVKCSEHPDGSMMSTPAGPELQELRKRAHALMEQVFGDWYNKDAKNRMYAWLKTKTKSGHIGHATEDELVKVIKLLEKGV